MSNPLPIPGHHHLAFARWGIVSKAMVRWVGNGPLLYKEAECSMKPQVGEYRLVSTAKDW